MPQIIFRISIMNDRNMEIVKNSFMLRHINNIRHISLCVGRGGKNIDRKGKEKRYDRI